MIFLGPENETLKVVCFRRGCSGLAYHNSKRHGVVRLGRLVDNKIQCNQFTAIQACPMSQVVVLGASYWTPLDDRRPKGSCDSIIALILFR